MAHGAKRLQSGRLVALVAGLSVCLASAILAAQDSPDDALVANKLSKTYHKASCEVAKKITDKNRESLVSADEARVLQYKPCPICKPTVAVSPKKAEAGDGKTGSAPPGEMKPGSPSKTKKTVTKKGNPSDAKPGEPADGEMKADTASTPKAKTKKGATAKAATKKTDTTTLKDAAKALGDTSGLKFSEEIAPILAGNCVRCHNPQQKRGGFDMANFQKLMAGSKRKVIVPGKPDESELILRIKNESEGPKMPPGQANLAPESIAKIEEWVKAGAILNAGIDPAANLDAIAPTPEARRRKELAKLSPEERDKKLEEVGNERWKKASANTTPTVTAGTSFLLFSNLKPDRAERLMKTLEIQKKNVAQLLGPASNNALNGTEKISVYVFKDLKSYVEFVRSNESRETEQGVEAHGKLDVEQPYLASADPANGGDEPASASTGTSTKKSTKSKKAQASDDSHDGPDRTLAGLLTEQLTVSAVAASGKPPRWLSYGLGAFLASKVDPSGSGYYRKLRDTAADKFQQGWESKANEALGGEGDPETIRAIGFSFCDWQAAYAPRAFPMFLRGMLLGGEKLDDVIRGCFGDSVTRQAFLQQWGGFIATKYARRR